MLKRWPALRPESDNFLHLDALRIIASLGIVAFHWRSWLDLDAGARAIADGIDGFAYFVDLFFVISGFIICHVYGRRIAGIASFGAFLRKRLARLLPLHWATLAFTAAGGLAMTLLGFPPVHPDAYDLRCFVPSALLLHAFGVCQDLTFNFPSWSVSAEMGCYLLFPLFLALYRFSVWLPAAISVALVAALTLAGPLGPERQHWHEVSYYWGALRALPSFGLGVSLYGLKDRLRFPLAGVAMYALLLAFVALSELNAAHELILVTAYLIVVCGVSADSARANGALTRALAPWGSLTYSVYMLHVPLSSTLFALGARAVLHLSPGAIDVAVFAAVPVLLAVSYASYVWFETPARRWLSGRSEAARTAPAPQLVQTDGPG